MSKYKREYHITRWLGGRKIGDRFTASDISTEIMVANPRFVARFLAWQPNIRKVGSAHKSSSVEWEKIADVPEVPA